MDDGVELQQLADQGPLLGLAEDQRRRGLRAAGAGRVLAIDIQSRAIGETGLRLRREGLASRVSLITANHAALEGLMPPDWPGQVAAILFNLGPLPHGDRTIRTRPESTLKALDTASRLIRVEGRITIVLNPGDPAGRKEEETIRSWMRSLTPDQFTVEEINSPEAPASAPRLLVITARRASTHSTLPAADLPQGPSG